MLKIATCLNEGKCCAKVDTSIPEDGKTGGNFMKKNKQPGLAQRRGIAVISVLLALTIGILGGSLSYVSLLCSYIGGSTYKMEGDDGSGTITPYETNGLSLTDWKAEAAALVEDVVDEGIVLLKNDNDTLPLANGAKVSLFGRSSVDLVLGGTGAGSISSDYVVDLKTAMETAGFQVNSVLWDFYKSYDGKDGYSRSNGGYMGATADQIFVAEPPMSDYSADVTDSYEDYSDAAIVVISRVGGEGSDMPTGDFGDGTKYLALQEQEKELLEAIRDSGKFQKVIALINTSNAMELGWVEQEEYGIDACLWVGGIGQSGACSIANVLSGSVNPSGHLVDTYAADSFSSPAMQNFGNFDYTNGADIDAQIGELNNATHYVVYAEGIYIGYRYYETRYSDSVTNPVETNATSSAGAFMGDSWNYTDEVVYPFGYGLSYGAEDGQPFTQEIISAEMVDDTMTMEIRVTNNGDVAGKSVVQLYAQQPYISGGTEKSAIQLVGFDKTEILQPGESAVITIEVDKKEFASYDYQNEKTYVLDQGEYYFSIGNDAHDALNNVLAAQGNSTANGMDYDGDATKVYQWSNPEKELLSTSYSGETITNQFDSASLDYYEGQEVTYLTRSDWNTFPKTYEGLTATDAMISDMDSAGTYVPGSSDLSEFTFGEDSGLTIAKMIGLDYDDPQWDTLLNQMTLDDMVTMVTGSALKACSNIAYPAVFMKDGPQGNNVRTYVEDNMPATGFCGEVVRASTFNRALMREVGIAMGEDWLRTDTEGAYTPAVNIHRTPYAGRNFEYYSEDGFLSGEMAYEEVVGIQSRGAISYIKHFALNDQETNRIGVCTFANEQAIREIYLKAFEKSFCEGQVKGSMGAFNRIGCVWAGAYSGLQKGIVRTEWGSLAIQDTDIAINTTYQNVEAGLEGGNTLWATSGTAFYAYLIDHADQDAKLVANLREACHIILYQMSSSSAMNGLSSTAHVVKVMPYWEKLFIGLIVVFVAMDVLLAVQMVRKSKRAEKEEV
jgi:beta-glucosidase